MWSSQKKCLRAIDNLQEYNIYFGECNFVKGQEIMQTQYTEMPIKK